jgi:HNH endonuclease
MKDLTQEEVKELFWYRRGHLYWRPRSEDQFRTYLAYTMWNKRYANQKAGCANVRGYVKIAIQKKSHLAHRLIWLYHHGWLPEALDHINNKPWDNRLCNLRPATRTENRWNSRTLRETTTNVKGVYRRPNGMYETHVMAYGKRYYLGRFARKSDAIKRVREAREALHKEFARD